MPGEAEVDMAVDAGQIHINNATEIAERLLATLNSMNFDLPQSENKLGAGAPGDPETDPVADVVDRLQKDKRQLEGEVDRLKKEVRESQKIATDLEKRHGHATSQVEDKNAKNEQLQAELDKMKKDNSDAVAALERDVGKLEAQLAEAAAGDNEQLAAQKTKNEQLQAELDKMKKDNSDAVAALERDVGKLEAQLAEAAAGDNEQLAAQKTKNEQLQAELDKTRSELVGVKHCATISDQRYPPLLRPATLL